MNVFLSIILAFTDAFFYGYCYEYRIAREKGEDPKTEIGIFDNHFFAFLYNSTHLLVKLFFLEFQFRGKTYVPLYRLFIQWPLDGLALWYLWNPHWGAEEGLRLFGIYLGTWEFWGFLMFIYAMGKELGYYLFMGQWKLIAKEYEEKSRLHPRTKILKAGYTYWLERLYFAGAWLFIPYYSFKKFYWSVLIGFTLMCISNFLK